MDPKEAKKQEIAHDIEAHPILLYMKGEKAMPMCGFSAKVVNMLNLLGVDFETRNVLTDEVLRECIKEFSDWPTIPQLYIQGEFIGGCDIALELYRNGTLANIISKKASG